MMFSMIPLNGGELDTALNSCHFIKVKNAIEKEYIDFQTTSKDAILKCQRNSDIQRLLLNSGASLRKKHSFELLSNSFYLPYSDRVPLLHTYLEFGADINAVGRNDNTIVLVAASRSYLMLEAVLQAGADPNYYTKYNQGAILRAALSGKPANIELLHKYGAKFGEHNIDVYHNVLIQTQYISVIQTLLRLYPPKTVAEKQVINRTLVSAISRQKYDLVRAILFYHQDIDVVEPNKLTPKAILASKNDRKMSNIFFEAGIY